MSDFLSVFSGAETDLCFLSCKMLYIDAVMYMNIKLSSSVSLLARGFPRKREKLMQIMMKKLLNFFSAVLSLAVCLCCLLWTHVFEHKISHEVLTFGRIL